MSETFLAKFQKFEAGKQEGYPFHRNFFPGIYKLAEYKQGSVKGSVNFFSS